MIRRTTMIARRPSWVRPAAGMARILSTSICKQPGTARFLSRHLYNFFVADEVPVPSWRMTPPKDMAAISSAGEGLLRLWL